MRNPEKLSDLIDDQTPDIILKNQSDEQFEFTDK